MISMEQESQLNSSIENRISNIEYSSEDVRSFPEAVDKILKIVDGDNSFCMVDVDGTIIENAVTMYPGLCYFEEPKIGEDVKEAFSRLMDVFDKGNICIATNRDPRVKFPWDSHKMISVVKKYLSNFEKHVPIFPRLNKQIAQTKFGFDQREILAEYVKDYVLNNDLDHKLTIYSIQDLLPVYFKVDTFPKEISKMIFERVNNSKEGGVSIDIRDFVIKK